jgi:mannose-6-phosphate isomerase-like protein (cupin superfamily)
LEKNQDISLDFLRTLLTDEKGIAPLKADLDDTEIALNAYAKQHAVEPPLSMREKIMSKMQKLNAQALNRQPFTLENLPILTAESNWLDWEAAVEGIEPPPVYDNIHLHSLEANDTRELFVAWVQELIPEEVHFDLLESFVLLEGTCECHIWSENGDKRLVRMQAGDFIEMKIGENHDIYITSPKPVKAILQWLKMAA